MSLATFIISLRRLSLTPAAPLNALETVFFDTLSFDAISPNVTLANINHHTILFLSTLIDLNGSIISELYKQATIYYR